MTMNIKKGHKGKVVKIIQRKLNLLLSSKLIVDGDFGAKTKEAILIFQRLYNLPLTGMLDSKTSQKLNRIYANKKNKNSQLLHFGKPRFVIFVDAGHGGIADDGRYVTPGKRAHHNGCTLHQNGYYYEGFENRLVAEHFIEACTQNGIMCIRTYHPHRDTKLSERAEIVRSYLRRGYYGYLHSFHSNAISSKNKPQRLDTTRGFMVFNTTGNNFSDTIATKHFEAVKMLTNEEWIYREQSYKDGDPDFEVNFQILRETDLEEFEFFGSILEEWGFHSSKTDAQLIVSDRMRSSRVAAALTTAFWVKEHLNELRKARL